MSEGPVEQKRFRFPVWPEWNEAEVNAEKWDAAKGGKDAKTGKSPCGVSLGVDDTRVKRWIHLI